MSANKWGAATVYETVARGVTPCRVCGVDLHEGSPCLARHWHDAKGTSHQSCGYWVLDDLEPSVRAQLLAHVRGAPIDRVAENSFLYSNLRSRDGKWTKKGELLIARVKGSEAA